MTIDAVPAPALSIVIPLAAAEFKINVVVPVMVDTPATEPALVIPLLLMLIPPEETVSVVTEGAVASTMLPEPVVVFPSNVNVAAPPMSGIVYTRLDDG